MRVRLQLTLVLCLGLLTALVGSTPALADGRPSVTIAEKSVFLRDAPNYQAERTYSVFQGQTYGIVGRTPDGLWLKLDFAGATE